MPWTHRVAAATSLWLLAAAAHAQPPADGLEVTLGVGAAPDYLGSDDYMAARLPGFQYRRGDLAVRSNAQILWDTMAQHEINYKRIRHLQNPLIAQFKSRKLGGQLAISISYLALTLMVLHLILKTVEG